MKLCDNFIDTNGIKIYFASNAIDSAKDSIVFLHGFGLSYKMWVSQLEYFSDNYNVVAVDARGHGRSDSPETNHARENRVEDINNVINKLPGKAVHLVGHSMGGGDAVAYAIDHADSLRSLTLLGTVVAGWKPVRRYKDYADIAKSDGIAKALDVYKSGVLSYFENRKPSLKEEVGKILDEFDGIYWLDPMKGKYPIRNDLELCRNIKIPTLILSGQHDIYFRKLAEKLHGYIAGSKLKIIENAGHLTNMENPEMTNEIVNSFLESL